MNVADVRVEAVSKEYRLGTRRSAVRFLALDNLSFEIPRGTALGVVGPNGAGKSTLMKLLAGITAPTRGRITIRGVLSALIEVGSGFHPELTGRENVFLSGAILGMRRREIAERFERIVAFAGVERFIDTPVKWYSSGMYVRLGFAVAAHLSPDVLLVDEVLAVGDAEFQARCLQRIRELRAQGTTLVLISHDLSAVQQLCDTALLLDRGRLVTIGLPADVVAAYHRRIVRAQKERGQDDRPADGITVRTLTLHDRAGAEVSALPAGDSLQVRVVWDSPTRGTPVATEVSIHGADGHTRLATLAFTFTPARPAGAVAFTIPTLPLVPGTYYVAAVLRDARTGQPLDWWDGGTTLHVHTPDTDASQGPMVIPFSATVHDLHAGG
ncbi:MAG: polysaccharide ABC transporter ATP-binding protein [Vicinamibacterales bacterium]